jgi:hypothetical protein
MTRACAAWLSGVANVLGTRLTRELRLAISTTSVRGRDSSGIRVFVKLLDD